MATYPFPTTVRPAEVQWQMIDNTQSFESPLSGVEQIAELPGAKWMAMLRFENLKRHEIADLEAFILQLRGKANRTTLWHHARETPRGNVQGTPLVRGAGQNGASISSDGWTAGQNSLLLPGDHIGIGGELKMVTANVNSDASGIATINFEPPLRYAPADNSLIVTSKPAAKFMLLDNRQGRVASRRALNGTTLTFIEDIR